MKADEMEVKEVTLLTNSSLGGSRAKTPSNILGPIPHPKHVSSQLKNVAEPIHHQTSNCAIQEAKMSHCLLIEVTLTA